MRILPGLKVQETTIRAAAPIVVAALIATSPMAAVAGDAKKGIDIFDANCAACHAGGQNIIMPDKNLQKEVCETFCRMPLPFALGKHCFVIVSLFIHALRLTHCFVSLLFYLHSGVGTVPRWWLQ